MIIEYVCNGTKQNPNRKSKIRGEGWGGGRMMFTPIEYVRAARRLEGSCWAAAISKKVGRVPCPPTWNNISLNSKLWILKFFLFWVRKSLSPSMLLSFEWGKVGVMDNRGRRRTPLPASPCAPIVRATHVHLIACLFIFIYIFAKILPQFPSAILFSFLFRIFDLAFVHFH